MRKLFLVIVSLLSSNILLAGEHGWTEFTQDTIVYRWMNTRGVVYKISSTENPDVTILGSFLADDFHNIYPTVSRIDRMSGDRTVFQNALWLCSIRIPYSISSFNACEFMGCSSLTNVEFYAAGYSYPSFRVVSTQAFKNCSSLTNIQLPNSLYEIGNEAFSGCSSLKQINIPSSVTNIGDFAFCNCEGFTSVTIPASVKVLGHAIFHNCTSLTNIIFEGDCPVAPDDVWSGIASNCVVSISTLTRGWTGSLDR